MAQVSNSYLYDARLHFVTNYCILMTCCLLLGLVLGFIFPSSPTVKQERDQSVEMNSPLRDLEKLDDLATTRPETDWEVCKKLGTCTPIYIDQYKTSPQYTDFENMFGMHQRSVSGIQLSPKEKSLQKLHVQFHHSAINKPTNERQFITIKLLIAGCSTLSCLCSMFVIIMYFVQITKNLRTYREKQSMSINDSSKTTVEDTVRVPKKVKHNLHLHFLVFLCLTDIIRNMQFIVGVFIPNPNGYGSEIDTNDTYMWIKKTILSSPSSCSSSADPSNDAMSKISHNMCIFQAFINQWSTLGIIFWHYCINFSIFEVLALKKGVKKFKQNLQPFFIVVTWVIPIVIASIGLFSGIYGYTNTNTSDDTRIGLWCWISESYSSWRFLFFYIPVFAIFIHNIIIQVLVFISLRKHYLAKFTNLNATLMHAPTSIPNEIALKQFVFILAFIMTFMFGFVHRSFEIFNQYAKAKHLDYSIPVPFWLLVLHVMFDCLHGVFTFLVYIFTTKQFTSCIGGCFQKVFIHFLLEKVICCGCFKSRHPHEQNIRNSIASIVYESDDERTDLSSVENVQSEETNVFEGRNYFEDLEDDTSTCITQATPKHDVSTDHQEQHLLQTTTNDSYQSIQNGKEQKSKEPESRTYDHLKYYQTAS